MTLAVNISVINLLILTFDNRDTYKALDKLGYFLFVVGSFRWQAFAFLENFFESFQKLWQT